MAKVSHYTVTHRSTGKVYTYKTRQAARRALDRMDNAYGAYICTLRTIWEGE